MATRLQTRTSVRYSTYSTVAPSFATTVRTTDSVHAEIRNIETGLTRLENKALAQQRVVLSEEKSANLSKLALGAKLERALDRRMRGQDAEMRPRAKSSAGQMTQPNRPKMFGGMLGHNKENVAHAPNGHQEKRHTMAMHGEAKVPSLSVMNEKRG